MEEEGLLVEKGLVVYLWVERKRKKRNERR